MEEPEETGTGDTLLRWGWGSFVGCHRLPFDKCAPLRPSHGTLDPFRYNDISAEVVFREDIVLSIGMRTSELGTGMRTHQLKPLLPGASPKRVFLWP